jgi:hypothetical protein
MELLKIVLGLAVIAVIVVAVGLDKQGTSEQAAAPRQVERSFSSDSSSARFVQVADD